MAKGSFKSEYTGKILRFQHKYVFQITILSRKFEKLFTVLDGKFKFSVQDYDLGYLCWRCKNSPVSSDLKPPPLVK